MYDCDDPAKVVYYLANNKSLTAKLAQMTDRQRVRELAKIEIKLEDDKPIVKKQSEAPEPISPHNGQGGNEVKSLDDPDLTFEEYERLSNQQSRKGGDFL